MAEWITVARADTLGPGEREVFDIDGVYIAVFNVDGAYYALEDRCTHDDGPLAEGALDDHTIECPRHGARFDIRNGAVLALPAVRPIHHFEVRVQDGNLQIYFDL